MFHHEHHSVFVLHKMMHDRMTKLYVFQAVFTFLRAMLGLFVPIYLFSLGFSFPHIFFYAMMTSVTFLMAIPVFIWIIRHIGFKYTLLLSIPLYLTHIWTLNFVTDSILYFHLAWLGFGLYLASFWPAFHSEVAVNGHKGHRGSEVGTLQVLSMFMASLAPMIGGFVLEAFTYGVLVSLATCMLLIGIVPLLLSKDIHLKHYSFHYADYFKLRRKHQYLRDSTKSFRAEGTQNLLGLTIWPIILFILLDENFFIVGSLQTGVAFLSMVLIVYIKQHLDTKNKKKVLKKSCQFLSFNWFLRGVAVLISGVFLFVIEAIYKLSLSMFSLSFFSIFYQNAKQIGYMNYILYREFCLHSTKILLCLLGIFLFLLFEAGPWLYLIFALIAVYSSMMIGTMPEMNEK